MLLQPLHCSAMSHNGSIITLRHIFGLKGDVKDNIHYIDESTVMYPAGYNGHQHTPTPTSRAASERTATADQRTRPEGQQTQNVELMVVLLLGARYVRVA